MIVDGKPVLRNGRLATLDEAAIYAKVEAVMPGFPEGLRRDRAAHRRPPALSRQSPPQDLGCPRRHAAHDAVLDNDPIRWKHLRRHCEERRDEATQSAAILDCFTSLAMTMSVVN
ncbi:MAG: hypothetical protein WDO24_13705 [Pseudomonadota bacterium]